MIIPWMDTSHSGSIISWASKKQYTEIATYCISNCYERSEMVKGYVVEYKVVATTKVRNFTSCDDKATSSVADNKR